MKQLKFMLAAAAAISLATAAQAATTKTYTVGTAADAPENFNAETLQNQNPVDAIAGYSFTPTAPATEADNESVIKGGVLEVNTGTDPLLRALDYSTSGGSADNVELKDVDSLNIDTKVQFTVTPIGDSVTAVAGDKLMIYLQQTNEVVLVEETEVTNTVNKLMVKAGKVTTGGGQLRVTEQTYIIDNYEVNPNEWYRLFVTASLGDRNVTYFQIKLGSPTGDLTVLKSGEDDKFASLDENKSTALTHVGFAGEGKVDDLLVWTEKTVTTVDFTLAVTGGSAVSVTIGDTDYNFVDGKVSLPAGATFTVNYTVDAFAYTLAWSNLTGCEADDATVTLAADAETASATLALAVATGDDATPPTVPDGATAESVGITSPAFEAAAPAELQKLINWAAKKGVSKTDVNAIPPFEADSGNATNTVQEAYLLNCALSDVATEKANFKFSADDLADLMQSGFGAKTDLGINKSTYNGTFVL